MTNTDCDLLIAFYAEVARRAGITDTDITEIDKRYNERLPCDIEKKMRWVGFCQGYLVHAKVFTVGDVRRHSTTTGPEMFFNEVCFNSLGCAEGSVGSVTERRMRTAGTA